MTITATVVASRVTSVSFGGGPPGPDGPQGPAGDLASVATRSALSATTAPTAGMTRFLTESGREGIFKFVTGDLSAMVTADPAQNSYVASNSVPSTSGAWVRASDSFLVTALAAKIAATEKGVANGVADLDANGLLPTNRLPGVAISSRFLVASEAAMIALSAQEGDVAIRSDISKTFIRNTGTAGTVADWDELLTPTGGGVTSVAGKSGTVTLVKGDVGLANVDNTSDANKPVSTAQQTALNLKANVAPAIQSVTSAATVTPTFANDQVNITAQAAALTLANPTGTAVDGWGIAVRIKDNGTARTIAYGTQYRAIGVTLPTTTVLSKTLYLGMVFNSADTKWDVLAVAQEA